MKVYTLDYVSEDQVSFYGVFSSAALARNHALKSYIWPENFTWAEKSYDNGFHVYEIELDEGLPQDKPQQLAPLSDYWRNEARKLREKHGATW